jgi:hypothetical protein
MTWVENPGDIFNFVKLKKIIKEHIEDQLI